MRITIEIPDTIAGSLAGAGRDPARAVLEAIAIEGYRTERLSEAAVRRLLGFETRDEANGFLTRRNGPARRMIVIADTSPISYLVD
jgi:hypothetical protein